MLGGKVLALILKKCTPIFLCTQLVTSAFTLFHPICPSNPLQISCKGAGRRWSLWFSPPSQYESLDQQYPDGRWDFWAWICRKISLKSWNGTVLEIDSSQKKSIIFWYKWWQPTSNVWDHFQQVFFLLPQEVDFESTGGGLWAQILHRLADRRSTFHFRLLQGFGIFGWECKMAVCLAKSNIHNIALEEWVAAQCLKRICCHCLKPWAGVSSMKWDQVSLGSASWIVSKLEIQIFWSVGTNISVLWIHLEKKTGRNHPMFLTWKWLSKMFKGHPKIWDHFKRPEIQQRFLNSTIPQLELMQHRLSHAVPAPAAKTQHPMGVLLYCSAPVKNFEMLHSSSSMS